MSQEVDRARGDRAGQAGVVAALGLITLVAFLPCLYNGFVLTWDDRQNLADNPYLRTPVLRSLSWAWSTYLVGVYQPLAWFVYRAEYALWGVEPWGYHLVSVLWHAVNGFLFFWLTQDLLARARPDLAENQRNFGAALAAALFVVHPLRVEVVAWASCQPYLPCAFFCLLSVRMYLRACAQTGVRQHLKLLVVCWALFLAALLCKALAVPLPFVLLALDVYPLRRLGAGQARWVGPPARTVWLEKLPFLVLSGLFAVLAYRARLSLEIVTQRRSLSARVAQVCYSIAYYPIKTVAPFGLLPFHPVRNGANLGEPLFQLCAVGVVCLSLALVLMRKRWPGMLAAWISYLLLLAPNAGVVRMGAMLIADRYSYLATMGGFVLAAAGIAELRTRQRSRRWNRIIAIAGLTLLLALLPLSWRQCRIWRTSEATWVHTMACFAGDVRAAPNSADAHHHLGIALYYCGHFDEAIRELRVALELDPALASAYASLAQALIETGRDDEAMAALSESVRLDPTEPDVHGALAFLLVKRGRLDEAKAEYRAALRLQPHRGIWHAGLGILLDRQGHREAAAAELSESVRLDPGTSHFQDLLRQVRPRQGRR
jgi:tetratricopeptide (TPR) repeat protein